MTDSCSEKLLFKKKKLFQKITSQTVTLKGLLSNETVTRNSYCRSNSKTLKGMHLSYLYLVELLAVGCRLNNSVEMKLHIFTAFNLSYSY